MKLLSYGCQGVKVSLLQSKLNILGANLKRFGTYNRLTEKFVKKYQLRNGLDDDGVVGPLNIG